MAKILEFILLLLVVLGLTFEPPEGLVRLVKVFFVNLDGIDVVELVKTDGVLSVQQALIVIHGPSLKTIYQIDFDSMSKVKLFH